MSWNFLYSTHNRDVYGMIPSKLGARAIPEQKIGLTRIEHAVDKVNAAFYKATCKMTATEACAVIRELLQLFAQVNDEQLQEIDLNMQEKGLINRGIRKAKVGK